jgi:hypothetical protein
MWWPYQGDGVFLSSLPCFSSTDTENISSLCLVAQVFACLFIEQRLARSFSIFLVHVSRCEGKARGEIESSGTGLRLVRTDVLSGMPLRGREEDDTSYRKRKSGRSMRRNEGSSQHNRETLAY